MSRLLKANLQIVYGSKMTQSNSKQSLELNRVQRVYNILKENPNKAYYKSWLQKETNYNYNKIVCILNFLCKNKLAIKVKSNSDMYYYNKNANKL